jgi:hypothetical protein
MHRYGRRRQPLTPDQEAAVRKALADGATRDQAAAIAGITRRMLDTRLRDQLADVRVGRGRGGGRWQRVGKQTPPTPNEIRMAAALVRQAWTPERWGARTPDLLGEMEPGRHGRTIADP